MRGWPLALAPQRSWSEAPSLLHALSSSLTLVSGRAPGPLSPSRRQLTRGPHAGQDVLLLLLLQRVPEQARDRSALDQPFKFLTSEIPPKPRLENMWPTGFAVEI